MGHRSLRRALAAMVGCAAAGVAAAPGAWAAAGDPDPSFGSHGVVRVDRKGADTATGLALQRDGKIVVSAHTGIYGNDYVGEALRLSADGKLDAGFGQGGVALSALPNWLASSLAIRPDGRIVLAGSRTFPQFGAVAEQWTPTGTLDTAYGGSGTGETLLGFAINASAASVALTPDGKLVLGGSATDAAGVGRMLAARLNADGTPDTSLGPGLAVLRPVFSGQQNGQALVLQRDGKPVIAGTTAVQQKMGSPPHDILVTRLLSPAGTTDPGFGTADGSITIRLGGDASVADMVLAPGGKLIVAADVRLGDQGRRIVVIRLNPDGTPDNTFGQGGRVTLDRGTGESARNVALQPDGKIVVVGDRSAPGSVQLTVLRLRPNGSVDATFGTAGEQVIDLGFNASAGGLAIRPDGRIVLAATTFGKSGYELRIVLVRLLGGKPNSTGGTVPRCMGLKATIVASDDQDKLTGTGKRDVIVGLGGADRIDGKGGNDVICAGGGNDTVFGGSGDDTVFGGKGDDTLNGGPGDDTLNGGDGDDTLNGGPGDDQTDQ